MGHQTVPYVWPSVKCSRHTPCAVRPNWKRLERRGGLCRHMECASTKLVSRRAPRAVRLRIGCCRIGEKSLRHTECAYYNDAPRSDDPWRRAADDLCLRESLAKAHDSRGGDSRPGQNEDLELGNFLEMSDAGVGDRRIGQIEPIQRGQFLQVCETVVGHPRALQKEHLQSRRALEVGDALIADVRLV